MGYGTFMKTGSLGGGPFVNIGSDGSRDFYADGYSWDGGGTFMMIGSRGVWDVKEDW